MQTNSVLSFPAVQRLLSAGKVSRDDLETVADKSEDLVLAKLVDMGLVTWSDVARARIEVAKAMPPGKGSLMLLQEARRAHNRTAATIAGMAARKKAGAR